MARILNLKNQGNATLTRTSTVVMEHIHTHFDHDVYLAAAVFIPASFVWFFLNSFWGGVVLGGAIFAAIEYGYPAYNAGKIDIEPARQFYAQLRDMIRSRVARRA